MLTEQRQHHLRIVQLGFRRDSSRHTKARGPLQGQGIRLITNNEGTVYAVATLEVANEVLTVRAASRHKDGYIYFLHTLFVQNVF